ncbi:sphingomyelin phosphodiesterase 3 [Maylandia zebra]|uniref:Sphingomyelin phosphodiesterase 3 n=3 Tax=Haplochromini TaxID=319058 RepID=A0A3P9CFJ6_9CICH|nr:sphingomyelin phosphodiesterase 3 [Maylandia zebra]XP_005949028.1 sphingomyelin phosphodiesterase 3 [Haplochromis burtoni]XP_023008933.1 sphingomyelin phosphodiesterase 3 [Maylandia zebra]XP_023008934.1 sphingomyelin phosphodiesterase 3 [Maylandia zebra]XP_026028367.1 sphingomyelin phosphodiesterase 3 isoform X1 [Astatotilapia calliptera]XP_026028368.1 sphingomyelin phosphodiesterase 3 isoform X1 [Astatotilapia calliptera]XP_042070845.1 sphingomyelin phosphodiesterase 3 [Haplochromis burto
MVLHITPYSSACLHFLDGLSWSLVFPCYWFLDRLLASCVATSLEKRQRSQDPCSFLTLCVLISAPLYLLLLLASLPFALLGFIIWAPLQAIRQPYLYTYCRPDKHQAEQGQAGAGIGEWRPQGRSFCFCSANVCLLPDSLARFNNLSDTHRRAREVGKRIRNGASRPQIKIYIDSPTNTSISAASFSSLATGFRRTSSLDQRPDQTHTTNGPADTETEPATECPIHPSGATDCPVHPSVNDQGSAECPVHPDGADTTAECPLHQGETKSSSDCPIHTSGEAPDCPVHSTVAQSAPGHHDCPMHGDGTQPKPATDCPLHTSGVQISISAPEPDPQEEEAETGNHRPGEHGGADTGSMTASRESLARYHGSDGGIGISSNNTLSHVPRTSIFKRPGRKRRHGDETFDHDISAFFPANLDFLALQEVFDHGSTTRLRRQLHRYFPYILSDVGRYGWKGCCSRFKFLNSGLMLASRYPILDARYECYPNGRGEDALAAKGALFAKVHVGTSHQEQRVVGYVTCTHLHAIEGDASVRCEQLDRLLQWGAEFRQSSSIPLEGEKVLEDLVAFDVILGDLNFDNCSSEDKLEQQHALFTQYKDPCRLGPGEDKPWALGTLLDPSGLYDEDVSSPESLQKLMENEEGRKEYLVFPPSKSQCPASSQKGRKIPLKGNGRRIDYILYSDEGLQQDWKLEIEEFSFVTQLAGLTDHLSVAMRLAVSTGEEEP